MSLPVVTVASGGLPVVDVTATFPAMGRPVTEALNGRGIAVTKVAGGGMPVTYSSVVDYPPPFTPLSLAGLIGWWDASVTASLTLSGANVTAWGDLSGGGHTLGNAGNVPYSATAFNTSYPGLTFVNGNSANLGVGSFPMGTGNTLTAWYVGTCASGASTANGRSMSYAQPGLADYTSVGSWCTNNNSAILNNTTLSRNSLAASMSGLAAFPAGHRFINTIDSSGVMTVYVDGVASATGTSPGNWVSGGNFVLGRQAGLASDYWYGTIAGAGVATGFSNPATVAQLDAYLKNKSGL